MVTASPTQFQIEVKEGDQQDLQQRLRSTRLPDQQVGVAWEQGTNIRYLEELLQYWRSSFDWYKQQKLLNTQLDHYKLQIDEINLHFIHHPSSDPEAIPLLLVHGWPGSFYEYYKVITRLLQGGTRRSYHIVAPSLPGYGFSSAPPHPGFGAAAMAATFDKLMLALGYSKYVVQGGDWGGLISFLLGVQHSEHCRGIHTNFPFALPKLYRPWHVAQLLNFKLPILNKIPLALTEKELKGLGMVNHTWTHETGYQKIQQTKPQTLGFALHDSPAGLAAWIIEKFRTWSDCNGDLDSIYSKDELLTNICIYWFSGSITSSCRLYLESMLQWQMYFSKHYCKVPTAVAKFPADPFTQLPRAWIEQSWNVQQYTELDSGGHFPGLEQPDALIRDMDCFYSQLKDFQ